MTLEVLQIFGLRGWEWVIILAIIILIFGAKKIPEIARSLGRAAGEFRKGRMESERELREAAGEPTSRERLEAAAKALGIDPTGKTDDELRALITSKAQSS